jgi:hypothetical protein
MAASMLPLGHPAVTVTVCALPFGPNQAIQNFSNAQGSGPVMIAVLQREKLAEMAALDLECNVPTQGECCHPDRGAATVGGLDRRLGDAGPVGQNDRLEIVLELEPRKTTLRRPSLRKRP